MTWKKTANVEPIERRRSLKILIQGEKLRRLPSHPVHTNLAQPTKNRLKRQSLNHQYKELSRTHQDIVDVPTELLTDPAWQNDRETDIQIFLSVPGITSKEQLPGELRNLTLALTADRFPHTAWTHVYTDGSAEEGMKNSGSGVYTRSSDGDTTSSQFLVAFSAPTIELRYWLLVQLQSTRWRVGKNGKYRHLHRLSFNPSGLQLS